MGVGEMDLKVFTYILGLYLSLLHQNPTHFLGGGTRAAVSLMEPITQIIAQIQKIAHPKSRAMMSILNGCYGVIKHHDEATFKLGNSCGTMISRKSALKVIDKYTDGMNPVR